MTEQRMKHLLMACGYDSMSRTEQEDFCYQMASLCHAYKLGLSGNDMIPAANAFLAEYGRDPLPFSSLQIGGLAV